MSKILVIDDDVDMCLLVKAVFNVKMDTKLHWRIMEKRRWKNLKMVNQILVLCDFRLKILTERIADKNKRKISTYTGNNCYWL